MWQGPLLTPPDATGDICTTKTATAYDRHGEPATWTVTNPCDGDLYMPTRITALSNAGFMAWEDDLTVRQSGVEFSNRVGNISFWWADGAPGPFRPPLVTRSEPRDLGMDLAMTHDGGPALNLSQPFELYFAGQLVMAFP